MTQDSEELRVEQVDRDAANAFFLRSDVPLSVKMTLGYNPAPLVDTLARHRLQSQTVVAGDGAARIGAADAYWREKAYHKGKKMFALPGGFFWCELIAAIDAATPSPHPIASASEDTAGVVERARCRINQWLERNPNGGTEPIHPDDLRALAALPASEHGRDRDYRELLKVAADIEAAIFLAGEYKPTETITDFQKRCDAWPALQKWLYAHQHDDLQPQSGEAGA